MKGGIDINEGRKIWEKWEIECEDLGKGKNERKDDEEWIEVDKDDLRMIRCEVEIINKEEKRKCEIGKIVGRKIEIKFRRRGEKRNIVGKKERKKRKWK